MQSKNPKPKNRKSKGKKKKKGGSSSSSGSSSTSSSLSSSSGSASPRAEIYLIGETHSEIDFVEKAKNGCRDNNLESKKFILVKEGVPYSIKLPNMNYFGMEDPIIHVYMAIVWSYQDIILFNGSTTQAIKRLDIAIQDYSTFLRDGDRKQLPYFKNVEDTINKAVTDILDADRAGSSLDQPIMTAIENVILLIKGHPVFPIFKTQYFIALDISAFKSLQLSFSQSNYDALWNGVKRELREIVMCHWVGVTLNVLGGKNRDVAVIVGQNHVTAFSGIPAIKTGLASGAACIFKTTDDFLTAASSSLWSSGSSGSLLWNPSSSSSVGTSSLSSSSSSSSSPPSSSSTQSSQSKVSSSKSSGTASTPLLAPPQHLQLLGRGQQSSSTPSPSSVPKTTVPILGKRP